MKILQIDVNFDNSSTGKIVKDLQEGFIERGHQATSCYGRGKYTYGSEASKIANPFEIYTHALLTRLTGHTGIYSPLATRSCIAKIEAFRPDIVHLHELHGYYINIKKIVSHLKCHKIPTLWTFHCEFMYTGKCGHTNDCERWKTGCGQCPQLSTYPASFFLDQTQSMLRQKQEMFANFDNLKIITPSEWLANRVKQSFLQGKAIDVIYNGIDTEIFQPRTENNLRKELGIKTKHIILSIAPDLMSEHKGGQAILDLAKRMTMHDITFIMIGVKRPDKITNSNIIAIPKISDKILLSQYYSLADFFLLTSKKETFSLVCAESLACGTPIIGYDAGATAEVAPPGYGLFVKNGDTDSLYNVAIHAINNINQFNPPESCVKYARNNFSKNAMISNYLNAYKELLQK